MEICPKYLILNKNNFNFMLSRSGNNGKNKVKKYFMIHELTVTSKISLTSETG